MLRTPKLTKKITSKWIVFTLDHFLLACSLYFSLSLVCIIGHQAISQEKIFAMFIANFLISTVGMSLTKTYSGIIRHSETRDISLVLKFSLFQLSVWFFVIAFSKYVIHRDLLSTIMLMNFGLSNLLLIGLRLLVKEVYAVGFKGGRTKDRLVIYGAGNMGIAAFKAMTLDHSNSPIVHGFIDEDPAKQDLHISGFRIYPGSNETIRQLIKKNGLSRLVIACKLSPERIAELTAICAETGVKINTVPPIRNWVNGELHVNQLRDIKIETLLGRDQIQVVNEKNILAFEGSSVLVTGAAGSIGSEICRQLVRYPLGRLILVDQSESGLHDITNELAEINSTVKISMELCNIREERRVERFMNNYRPQYIFHAAAYKHVPILENFPWEVISTNVKGTMIMADAARKYRVKKFVMISTDKAVNPTNVMGACKRIAEMYVQSLTNTANTQFITTRFGNVLGSNGSVVPTFKKQIEKGGPVTVTHQDITRYFMTIPEASNLVLEAAVMGNDGDIFVFDMGNPVKIYDLAKNMIELSGKRPNKDIDIVFNGLRPGEKMFEELFSDKENLLPTHHPKIMKARKSASTPGLVSKIDWLLELAESGNAEEIRTQIGTIVPEYKNERPLVPVKFIYANKSIQQENKNNTDKVAAQ